MKKTIFIAMCATATLLSCSKSDDDTLNAGSRIDVKATVTVADEFSTTKNGGEIDYVAPVYVKDFTVVSKCEEKADVINNFTFKQDSKSDTRGQFILSNINEGTNSFVGEITTTGEFINKECNKSGESIDWGDYKIAFKKCEINSIEIEQGTNKTLNFNFKCENGIAKLTLLSHLSYNLRYNFKYTEEGGSEKNEIGSYEVMKCSENKYLLLNERYLKENTKIYVTIDYSEGEDEYTIGEDEGEFFIKSGKVLEKEISSELEGPAVSDVSEASIIIADYVDRTTMPDEMVYRGFAGNLPTVIDKTIGYKWSVFRLTDKGMRIADYYVKMEKFEVSFDDGSGTYTKIEDHPYIYHECIVDSGWPDFKWLSRLVITPNTPVGKYKVYMETDIRLGVICRDTKEFEVK